MPGRRPALDDNSPVRIGLVFGGASGEHAVSIRSAATVIAALEQGQNKERFSVTAFYIDRDGRWWPEDIARAVLATGLPAEADQLPSPLPAPGLHKFPGEPMLWMSGTRCCMDPMVKTAPCRDCSR